MIRINLIPPEFAQFQSQREQKIIFGSLGAVVGIFLMLFLFVEMLRASRLESKIQEAQGTLQQYQAIVDQIKDIEDKKGRLTAKRDVIVGLNRSRLVFPVFFEDLLPLVPSDVWVADIRLDRVNGNSMEYKLNSRAASNYALATWLTNLQQSTNFSNVKLDRISYDYLGGDKDTTQPILTFQLSFTYQHQGAMPLTQ
jgi:type IV pilus assembly protein PilN